ncbi:MAG: PEP-CTERM sorting domain-containing protein [Myxococcota bacterium]
MMQTADRAMMRRGSAMALACLIGLVSVASAQNLEPVTVYATATNVDTGPNGALGIPAGDEGPSVYLWAASGLDGSSGPPCTEAGSGSTLCGIAFTLDVTGGYRMVDFQANPNFDDSTTKLPFRIMLNSSDHLVGNAFDLGEPSPGNRYLGRLVLETTGVNGDSQIVVSGSAIGADLTMRTITPETIVVPEPRAVLMLGVGAFALLSAARRRANVRLV